MVVFCVVKELQGHRFRLGILVLQQISDLPLIFPGNFRIAVTGRGITVIEGE